MGFLDGLLKGKGKADPLAELRKKVEKNPKDARSAHDLALQLKAKGDVDEAVQIARQAAQAHRDGGFLQKGVAVLKAAATWGSPTPMLLEDLAQLQLDLKHKEDARETLLKLRTLHRETGHTADAEAVAKRIAELGPGR